MKSYPEDEIFPRVIKGPRRESILNEKGKRGDNGKYRKVNFSPETKELPSEEQLLKSEKEGDLSQSELLQKAEEKKEPEPDPKSLLPQEKKIPRNNIVLVQNATRLLSKNKKNTVVQAQKDKISEFYLDVIGVLDKEENQTQVLPGKRVNIFFTFFLNDNYFLFYFFSKKQKNISEFDIWDEKFQPKDMVALCLEHEGPHAKSPIFKGGR